MLCHYTENSETVCVSIAQTCKSCLMRSLEIMTLSCEYSLQTMVSYLEYSWVIVNKEVNTLSHTKAKGPNSDMNG